MPDPMPIILLSGMAADERLFEPLQDLNPDIVIAPWIRPQTGETIRDYAARLARIVNPGGPCFVGGVSFGGMVAMEMATHLDARGCFLICSARSPDEFPPWWKLFRPLARFGPRMLGLAAALVRRVSAPSLSPSVANRLRRLSAPDRGFVRWATCAALLWRPSRESRRIPVFQIHGDADRTIPIRFTRPSVVIPGGGHLLPLTHPEAVGEFIRSAVFKR